MVNAKKGDFVEIKYTGYANGEMFDSNIEEDLKKAKSKNPPRKTIIKLGEKMIVPGLDSALEGKEVGNKYDVIVSVKEGFGERKRELMKTIPLKVFTERKIYPEAGMMLTLDDQLVRISAVSGARVIVDFNNPLAGKTLEYKVEIVRIVDDDNEKARALFEWMFRFAPEFEVRDKVIIKGPQVFESIAKSFSPKFKELMGKELGFELKEEKKEGEKIKESSPKND
ncbi:MAG: peptidylprolyl isomerase [Nanoarchaeota archaeon]